MLKIEIVVATTGRPQILKKTLELALKQTKTAARVIVVGASDADVQDVVSDFSVFETYVGPRGSCSQRNFGMKLVSDDCDVIFFMDDDFLLEASYLENVEYILMKEPTVVGITGELIADGAHASGFEFEEGMNLLSSFRSSSLDPAILYPRQALYGCNMSFRRSAISSITFDENLPLYGWLEDIDFSRRVAAHGRLVSSRTVTGVHLGHKSSRSSGVRMGYSQIANVHYLIKKGTMQPDLARKLLIQNTLANLLKSLRPEPWIDRRGRLRGNMRAIKDLFKGQIHPARVNDF